MPTVSTCADAALLERLRTGQLSVAEVEQLARHIEQCGRCAAAVESLSAEDTLMESLRAKCTSLDRPEGDVVAGLMARLKQLRSVASSSQDATTALPPGAAPIPAPTEEETEEVYNFLAPPRGPGEIGWLGPYRVLKVLGVGGMGVVFQAEDPALKRLVALKAMKPAVAANRGAKLRFVREAQTAAAIKNDHVVTIYQVGEDRNVPYLAMEYLEGEPLDEWLKRGRQPSLPQLLRMGREMALGLAAAHERGLIHRDIKPGNIWLERPKGRIKLLDFGLARAAADSEVQVTQSGAIVGTPAYMAPEQARGEKVDPRCDLFSLGCVLYRLATGAMPFKGGDTMSVLLSLAMDTPPAPRTLNAQLPPALGELIEKMLAKDPAARPASAKAVVQALQAIERDTTNAANVSKAPVVAAASSANASNEPTIATTSLPQPLLPSQRRRRPRVALVAGVLVLLTGIAAAAIVIRIKTADGRVKEIAVPEGATVEIVPKDGAEKPAVKKPIAPPVEGTLADEDKPFLLVRDGKTLHSFKTLAGLLAEHQNGDVIEVHANGPLYLPRIALEGKGLKLRAGPGYRPRFEAKGVTGGAPWIQVRNAPVTLDGCDFRCPPVFPCSINVDGGSAEIHNCRIFQPDSHNSGMLAYAGSRLHVSDSLLLSGFSHGTIWIGPKAEVELRNIVFFTNAYGRLGLAPPGGQKIRLVNCTFAGSGYTFGLHGKFSEPIDILASESVFHNFPSTGGLLGAPFSAKDLKNLIHWHGRDNFYNFEQGNLFFSAGDDPSAFKLMDWAAWRKFWGEEEKGGRHTEERRFALDALWSAPSLTAQLQILQPILERHRQKQPNVGPKLDLIGPGDAYVRALAAAGKAVPKEDLRPEVEEGGPFVVLRKGKAIRGYAELAAALDAAVDGDVVEIRSDKEIAGVNRIGQPGEKSLTLRAGAGYRPIIRNELMLGKGDRWVVEGLTFRGVLNVADPALVGRVTRLANCSFEPAVFRGSGEWFQFNGLGDPETLEVVNCFIPGSIRILDIAKGQRVRIVNSILAGTLYRPVLKGDHRLELQNCVLWNPMLTYPNAVTAELKETKLRVEARNCLFEANNRILRTLLGATHWIGSGNVYAIGNVTWAWEMPVGTEPCDINGWRKLWNSEADSIEVEPLRYDPRQWRLLPSSSGHGSAPGGKDYGADVDRIGRTTPLGKP